MNKITNNFDDRAKTWDENPVRVKLAKDIAAVIKNSVPLSKKDDVLDFGCGSGLVTLEIAPLVNTIIGCDNSQGMIDVLESKIDTHVISNVKTELIDVEQGGVLDGKYSVVVSAMALHHIKNTQPLLEQFYNVLFSGGYIAIADLEAEDGQFHENNLGVHHLGFDMDKLKGNFAKAGFIQIKTYLATQITKPIADGSLRTFNVFLIVAQKP